MPHGARCSPPTSSIAPESIAASRRGPPLRYVPHDLFPARKFLAQDLVLEGFLAEKTAAIRASCREARYFGLLHDYRLANSCLVPSAPSSWQGVAEQV